MCISMYTCGFCFVFGFYHGWFLTWQILIFLITDNHVIDIYLDSTGSRPTEIQSASVYFYRIMEHVHVTLPSQPDGLAQFNYASIRSRYCSSSLFTNWRLRARVVRRSALLCKDFGLNKTSVLIHLIWRT